MQRENKGCKLEKTNLKKGAVIMSHPLNLAKNQEDKSTGCCKFVCDMMKKFCRLLKDFSCKQPAYAFRSVKGSEHQKGRTMVEMLGVLAIIGILSIGGISLLRLSMNHHHANQAADDVERLALVVYEQFEDLPKGEIGEENRAEFNGNAIFEYIAVKDSSSSFYIDVPGIRGGQCSALLPKAQDKHRMAVVIKKKNGLDAYVKEFEKDVTKPKDLCQFAKEDGTKFKEEEIAAENLEKEITVRFYFNGNPTCADGCPVADLCNGCCCEGLSEGSSFCLNDVRDRLGDGVTRQERCCPKGTANCGGRCVDECDDGTEIDPETCTCKGECNPLDCPDYNPECCDTYACNPVEIAHCVDYDYKASDNECPCKECEEGFELEGGICVKIKLCKKTYPGDKVCPRDEECLDYGNDFDGDTQCCKCDNWLCKLDPDGCQSGECICAEWNSAETFGQKGQCCPCSKFKCHMPNNPDTCATYDENFTSRECPVCPSECKDGYQKKDDGHCYAICNTNGVDEARRVTGVLSDEVCADFTCPCAGNREERVVNGSKGCYCKYDANEDIARGCVRHDLENTGDNVCPCNQWRCVMPEVGSPDYNPCCVVRDNNKKWEEPNKACPCIADLSETGVSIGGQKYTEWGPNSNNTLCVRNCVDVNVDHCSSDGYEITKSWVYQNSPHDVVYCKCNKYDCIQGNPDALCREGSEHTSTTYTSTQVSNNGGVVPYCPCDCQCNMPNGNVDSALRVLITTGTNQQACSVTDCACLDSYMDEVRACPPNTTTKQCYCKENTISGCKEYDICSTSATGCPCASCFCVAPQNYSSSNDPHREKPTETVKAGALKDEDGTCYTSISNDEWTASKWENAKCGCLTDSNGKELEDRKGTDNVYRCYCKKRDAEHMPTGCVQNEYSFENADDGYCPCSVYACVEPKKSTDAGYNPCCKKYDTNQTFGTADNPCPCENGYDMSDDSVGLTISGTKYTGWKKSSDNKTCERVCANINNCPVLPEPENLPKWVYQTSPNEPVACPCQDGTCPCVMPMDTEQQKMRNNAATIDPVNGVCPTTENDDTRCPCNSGWDDDETNHLCQKACIEKGVPYSLSEGDCTCTSELIVKYTATQIENNNGVVPYCECDNTTRECPCLMPEPLAQAALRDETKIWDEPNKKCPCPDRCPDVNGVCTCPQPCNNPPCGTGVCVEHLCTNNDCGASCQTSYATSATCLIPHCVAIGSTAPYPCIACEDGYIVMQSGDCAKCVPIPEIMVAGACGNWGICDPDSGSFVDFCTYSRSAVCALDGTEEKAYFKTKRTYGACNPLGFWGKASVSNSENRRFIYNMMGSVSAATAKSYCKAQGQAENQDGTKGYELGTEQDLLSVKDKNGITGKTFWVKVDDNCGSIKAVSVSANGLTDVASPSPEHTRAFCDAGLMTCTSWTEKGTENGGCPDGFYCYFDVVSSNGNTCQATGHCKPVEHVAEITLEDNSEWVYNGYQETMNWWSAQSWCVSQGYTPASETSCNSDRLEELPQYFSNSTYAFWLQESNSCMAYYAEESKNNYIITGPKEKSDYSLVHSSPLCLVHEAGCIDNSDCAENEFCRYLSFNRSTCSYVLGECKEIDVEEYNLPNGYVAKYDSSLVVDWWSAQNWSERVCGEAPTLASFGCTDELCGTDENHKYCISDGSCVAGEGTAPDVFKAIVEGLEWSNGNGHDIFGHYLDDGIWLKGTKNMNSCTALSIHYWANVERKPLIREDGGRVDVGTPFCIAEAEPEVGGECTLTDEYPCNYGYFCLFDNPLPAPKTKEQCQTYMQSCRNTLGDSTYCSRCDLAYNAVGMGNGRCVPYSQYPGRNADPIPDGDQWVYTFGPKANTPKMNWWTAYSWCHYYPFPQKTVRSYDSSDPFYLGEYSTTTIEEANSYYKVGDTINYMSYRPDFQLAYRPCDGWAEWCGDSNWPGLDIYAYKLEEEFGSSTYWYGGSAYYAALARTTTILDDSYDPNYTVTQANASALNTALCVARVGCVHEWNYNYGQWNGGEYVYLQGVGVDANGECKPCNNKIGGCLFAGVGAGGNCTCINCRKGYGLIGGACNRCTNDSNDPDYNDIFNNCITFASDANGHCTCSKCVEGYYLSEGKCVYIPEVCPDCQSDETWYGTDHGGRCAEYEGNGVCARCSHGYVLEDGMCYECASQHFSSNQCSSECDSGVAHCERTIEYENDCICAKCSSGWVLNNYGECIKMPDTCISANWYWYMGKPYCTECRNANYSENQNGIYAFGINADGDCVACPTGCTYCSFDENGNANCTYCTSRYTMKTDQSGCTACSTLSPSCNSCSYSGSDLLCTGCDSEYALNQDGKGCTACSSLVPNCTSCSYDYGCSYCAEGYAAKPDGSECTKCPTNCSECYYDGDNLRCNTCDTGSYYRDDDGVCVCDTSEGYAANPSTGICKYCMDDGNCSAFTMNADGTCTCTACSDYTLKNGHCCHPDNTWYSRSAGEWLSCG